MPSGEQQDARSTLSALERKLVDLERELLALTAPVAERPEPPGGTGDPSGVDALRSEIAGLASFRDRLEAAAQDLVAEYDRLIERLTPPAAEGERTVVLDAGPFADIAALARFERALAEVAGAEGVRVDSFQDGRAQIDVRLEHPIALGERLRERLGLPITQRETDDGHLVIDVAAPDATTP
jgi:hypothetical protein